MAMRLHKYNVKICRTAASMQLCCRETASVKPTCIMMSRNRTPDDTIVRGVCVTLREMALGWCGIQSAERMDDLDAG